MQLSHTRLYFKIVILHVVCLFCLKTPDQLLIVGVLLSWIPLYLITDVSWKLEAI